MKAAAHKDDLELHKSLAAEAFAHASSVERALEEILTERFRRAFRCKTTPARLPQIAGARGIVADEAHTAMLVRLEYEADHPPSGPVEVAPGLVASVLSVFAGSRVRFSKLSQGKDGPLLIEQEGAPFGILIAPLTHDG